MNVGIVGLGKLGLPVAYAMAARGLSVHGHDPAVTEPPDRTGHEQGFEETIEAAQGRVVFCSLDDVVANCPVVFVAVQTPHEPRFEGTEPLPPDRADFDYTHLIAAVREIVDTAQRLGCEPTIAVISTVLPGTIRRDIALGLGQCGLVYNPSFIAMGTTIADFLDPEFVLVGADDQQAADAVAGVYRAVGVSAPVVEMSVESAELTKVAYNTFIGLKVAFANTLMEVCHKTPGADVDAVTDALGKAHRRLISSAYMRGGMGDGGGCHPRDNIALSWLARELGLSYDLFGAAMECREAQAAWLADLMETHAGDLPLGIMGTAYKPGSHIETGSAAILVKNLLHERGHEHVHLYDPHTSYPKLRTGAHCWLVGCRHPEFAEVALPKGSVVIDPWRYIPDQEGVTVIRVGDG